MGEPIIEWPRKSITFSQDPDLGRYPNLMLGFSDGSTCVVFGEKSWGLDAVLATAAG